ncbi:metalloregulator ArsR/SmtB family transcription factor [Streptomyces sp. DG2A-72]|uniref:ArsR/SmtB family transcription factor n=1 Tax=Streptomyces sp. DG2A-72 TaxID=3051386 RepID=UPI00265C71A2|nr:metalloregulator ArsR/SmtB family transcription factor [Streptomyces sp. DG2A-72]MDO0930343.1 metalloregulator ArsR/SmtB family transcription factor [Streptomyces sp. DG2A-72]
MDVQTQSWDADAADRAVAVLKAVADPSRYRLLWALSREELPVSRLAELLGAHVAATSQHLAKLRAAGLVTSRRDGTRIYYRAAGRVRGLLEEASLVAGGIGETGTRSGDAPQEAAELAQEQAVGPARARRLATEQ